MKNLVLVTFSWLMMITIIGSIIHSMTFLTVLYASGNEIGQFLWNCLTAVLLIPAYKGVYYIHSLWSKSLKDLRDRPYQESNPTEIPFFREASLSPVQSEPSVERPSRVTPPLSTEEVNKKLEEIRSSVDEKISKIKGENITTSKKDSSYFANKYTSGKSILVETLFDKEKEETSPTPVVEEKPQDTPKAAPKNVSEVAPESSQEKKTTNSHNKGRNHKKHYSKKRK